MEVPLAEWKQSTFDLMLQHRATVQSLQSLATDTWVTPNEPNPALKISGMSY